MSIIQMLFSANGRIRRRDYWLWSIALAIVYFALLALIQALIRQNTPLGGDGEPEFPLSLVFIAIEFVLIGLFLWINFNLMAKRAHDRGRPAILVGGISIVNLAYGFSQAYLPNLGALNTVLKLFALLVGLWVLVDLGCFDGPKGANQYGPSPKNKTAPADVF